MAATPSTRVRFVPIDPDSPQHAAELRRQRILCGWGADSVPGYINHIRDGVRTMYWIFPPEGEPDGPEVPEKLNLEREKTGPRAPDPRFRPFGHVALDWEDFAGERSLASREDGVCTISTFFILLSQQGKGLGSVVMREMERLVVQPPLNAKVMTLHTFDDSFASLPSYWAAQGLPFYPDYRKNPVWYARMGFEVFRQGVPRYPAVREDGTGYLAESVFMRKVLAQPEEAQAEQ